MFLSSKKLPKLMKEAYKGPGLRIGMIEGGLYMAWPNNWEVLLLKSSLCNKIKSTVIELYGQFPRQGEVLQIRKDDNVHEVPCYPCLKDRLGEADHGAVSTRVILQAGGDEYWLFQGDSGEIVMVRRSHLELIDYTEINYDIEGEPIGPSYSNLNDGIFYQNATGILHIHTVLAPKIPLIEAMKTMEFKEDTL